MRKELFYNPRLLIERIALESLKRRRLSKLKNTYAQHLSDEHIATLEFIELANKNYPIKVVYDIGANTGLWTQLLKSFTAPEVLVHAFEPIPKFQDKFAQTTKDIPNVLLHPVGLGNERKDSIIHLAGDASGFFEIGPLLTSFFPSVYKTGEQVVKMERLDDYVQENNLPLPDLMKLDIEGYEIEALKGGLKCMAHCKYLILEVSFVERHIGQPLFPDLVYFLAQHGFHLLSFPEFIHTGQKIYWTDILFENRNIG